MNIQEFIDIKTKEFNMNAEQKYYDWWLNETDVMVKKLEPYNLLKGSKDYYHKRIIASLFENQRLFNSVVAKDEKKYDLQRFNRINIQLLMQIFKRSPFMDWVGVQPMLGPVNKLFIRSETGELTSESIPVRTRNVKTLYPQFDVQHKHCTNLDYEAEVTHILETELSDEICHEVIGDLCNNCLTDQIELDEKQPQTKSLNNAINQISNNSTGRRYKWIIVSEKMMNLLLSDPKYNLIAKDDMVSSSVARVFYIGKLKNNISQLKVYCDRDFEDNKILYGYRGDWHDAGYFYAPYVFLAMTSPVNHSDDTTTYPMITRYGKYLKPNGHNYYKLVTINNVIFEHDHKPQIEENREIRSSCAFRVQKRELGTHPSNQHP